jgi:TRAP-type C4-dicarboxylate transport system permease small subunit
MALTPAAVDGAKRMLDRILGATCALILAVTAAAVIWQVFTRYIFGIPSTLTSEIARLLFMWLAMLGGAYAFGQGKHLAIDFLPMALQGGARKALELVLLAVVAAFAGLVMLGGGTDLVLRTLKSGQVTPTIGLPMGWIYMALPVAGATILFYCLWFALGVRSGRADGMIPQADANTTS